MQVILNYHEEEKTSLAPTFFQTVATTTLEKCDIPSLAEKTVTLDAVSVSLERIKDLNTTYRSKEDVTDILSFGEFESIKDIEGNKEEEIFLGELFFCNSYIQKAAQEDGVSIEREMAYIFSHGVLHLLGYDHSEKMFAIQDSVTEEVSPSK